jgi:hypothetical protein
MHFASTGVQVRRGEIDLIQGGTMDPFRTDPFSPIPGDPREDVLSLQSYQTAGDVPAGPLCESTQSVVIIICPSGTSGIDG